LVKWFDRRLLSLLKRRKILLFNIKYVILLCTLFPILMANNLFAVKRIYDYNKMNLSNYSKISGILVEKTIYNEIFEKELFLKNEILKSKNILFFSKYSYILSLDVNQFNRMPFQDIFSDCLNDLEFEKLIKKIKELKPDKIYFDDEKVNINDRLAKREHFYYRLKNQIKGMYKKVKIENGWEVFERIGNNYTGDYFERD
jgi:hypothetical protein